MSHVAKSKILEEIIIEIRKKGHQLPANVLSDLKSARTLMRLEKEDSRARGETEPKIDRFLANVESYLIIEADKNFDAERVQKWLAALDIAGCDSCVTVVKGKEEMRMILGVPRDQKGIRVEPIENLPVEKLEQMATDAKLDFRREKDGHLIVYGSGEAVKGFIKKISRPNGQLAK